MVQRSGTPEHRRGWPLLLTLLLPFLLLELAIGYFGVILLQRDSTARAEATLNEDLSRRFFEARSAVHDRELYLAESANLASNLEGMAAALRSGDAARATGLLESVMALKVSLARVVAVAADGTTLVDLRRPAGSRAPVAAPATRWSQTRVVQQAGRSGAGLRRSQVLQAGGEQLLVVGEPVCTSSARCRPAGVTLVALRLGDVLPEPPGGAVALYVGGRRVSQTGSADAPWPAPPAQSSTHRVTRVEGVGRSALGASYGPLELDGAGTAVLAVRRSAGFAFASAGAARTGLIVLLLVAMAVTVVIGSWLARRILRQVRATLEAAELLGAGKLAARAPVLVGNELGELARGVNAMAGQLESSYELLEARVQERTGEVRRLLAQRNTFFAALSHELRTPLAVIRAQSEMLMDDDHVVPPDTVRLAAATVDSCAQQLLTAVNQILEFARAEAGQAEVRAGVTSIDALLAEVAGAGAELARTCGLQWRTALPRRLPPVVTDPEALRSILNNLLANAVKYTAPGGQVTLSARPDGERLQLSVRDTGVGIPDEMGDSIFEPFARVPGNRPQRGEGSTGLGLALVRLLADIVGARVEYRSRPGRGTTFTVSLPLAPSPPAAEPAGRSAAAAR